MDNSKKLLGHKSIRLILLLFSLILVYEVRQHTFSEPLEADECVYMIIAQDWVDGGKPYYTAWDNKPIGTFIIYRIGIHLFGPTELTPRILSLWASFVTTFLLYQILRRYGIVSLLIGLCFIWPGFNALVDCHANGANMEIFLLPFILLAFINTQKFADTDKDIFFYLAILYVALSLVIKQVTLPFLLLPFIPLYRRFKIRDLIFRAICTLGIVFILHILLYSVFGYNPFILMTQFGQNINYVEDNYTTFYSTFIKPFFSFPFNRAIKSILPINLLGFVFLVLTLIRTKSVSAVLFISGYILSLISVVLPGRENPHYFIVSLPFFLLAFITCSILFEKRQYLAILVGAAALVYLGYHGWTDYFSKQPEEISNNKYGWHWFTGDRFIGWKMKDLGLTGKRIYVDGSHPGIMFYSENRPAIKYLVHWVILQNIITREALLEELEKAKPEICVIYNPMSFLPGGEAWLNAEYKHIGRIGSMNIFVENSI